VCVPFNRRTSSPRANNPTSRPPSRAQNRRGCFPRPSHLCQAEIHSQERNGAAPLRSKSARHSGANDDKASGPFNSSTTNLLTSIPRLTLTVPRSSGCAAVSSVSRLLTRAVLYQRAEIAPDVPAIRAGVFIGTARRKAVITSGQIDEAHTTWERGQKIISRILDFRRNSNDYVFPEVASGEIKSE